MAYFYEKIKALTNGGLTVTTTYNECQGNTPTSGNWGTSPQTPIVSVKKADNTDVNLGYQITSHMLLGYILENFQFAANVGIGNPRNGGDYGTTAGSDLTKFLKLQSIVFDRSYSITGNNTNPFSSMDSIMHFDAADYSGITLRYSAKVIREDLFNNSGTYARGISIGSDKNIKLGGDLSSVNVEHGSFLQLGTKWQAKSSDCIQICSILSQEYNATYLQNNPIAIFTHINGNRYGFGIAGTSTSNAKMQANIPIHAPYFNTTSDIRAKKDISKTTFAARDVIKTLPIYSYILKENNERNIGIIAQDALDVNLDGFELVKNKEATGKDGDYMAIKESKLVYVAWKAIQEQEEVIEKQQQEIDELKDLVRQLLETKK